MEVSNILSGAPTNLILARSPSIHEMNLIEKFCISSGAASQGNSRSCLVKGVSQNAPHSGPADKISHDAIHDRALAAARNLKKSEIELIEALKAVDTHKVYRKCGATSLFQYAVHILDLTESRAYDYITVMRKARDNSKLSRALHAGLSVTKARRISSHLVEANSEELISWAKTKSLRDLDNTLAAHFPNDYRKPERVRLQSSNLARLEANIDLDCEQLIRRVQDLESQRLRRPVTLGEVLKALARDYLEKKDPVKKAERWEEKRNSSTGQHASDGGTKLRTHSKSEINLSENKNHLVQTRRREPLRAATVNQVTLRDQGQCQALDSVTEKKCGSARWVDIHHIKPKSQGGADSAENLITLCSAHHRLVHGGIQVST